MRKFRQALSTLPTRPVLIVAPLIVVLVLALYYLDRHAKCTEMRQFRATLAAALDTAPAREPVRLADFTGFKWDRVRIVTGFIPRERDAVCPFGWNWPDGRRAALINSGALTALIFAHGDRIAAYRELDDGAVAIRGVTMLLTPQTAEFSLSRNADGGVTLKHLER